MDVTAPVTITSPVSSAAAAVVEVEVGPDTMRSSDDANNNKSVVTADPFLVEEFFDFSNEDEDDDVLFSDNVNANEFQSIKAESGSSVSFLVCNSPVGELGNSNLTSELCVPYDDLAELEWVSTFAEESFSTEDMEKLQFISGLSARPENESASATHEPQPDPKVVVPGKTRSKRPRTAPGNWTSRLLVVSTPESEPESDDTKTMRKPKAMRNYGAECLPVDGRKCQHCLTDKTPQWRTGPNGPKTLCNACGVRYKSGRLVPEYRPASSPTFVKTKHSNSHRKVLELRRQKEMMTGTHHYQHHQHQLFSEELYRDRDVALDGFNGEDYLIHRRVGPDFGQLI
ncbi:unnamed protein product [Rhodiola kirilowii]